MSKRNARHNATWSFAIFAVLFFLVALNHFLELGL